MRQSWIVQSTTALPGCLWLASLLVSPIREDYCAATPLLRALCQSLYLSRIAHVELEELTRKSLIVQTTALWERLWQSLLLGCPILNEGCADTKLLLLRVMALHGLCWCIAQLVDRFCQWSAWCNLFCNARPSESVSPCGISNPYLWLCWHAFSAMVSLHCPSFWIAYKVYCSFVDQVCQRVA
jgi:hypothetical protein